MKKIKLIIGVLVMVVFTVSCQKFLTVNPKTEMTGDALFSSEQGFVSALAGVYIQMKEDAAYGKALTMTTMEQLISSWDVTASTTDQKLGLFQYDDAGVETSLANIFLQQYKIIAGINIILANVDSKKAVFSPGNYELIKGECLALRAYVHFDLLRLFGPVPANATNANLLAYVKTVSKIANPHISVDAYKTELLNDLSAAEALLKDTDPFIKYSVADFKSGTYKSESEIANYRYLHMNYYAVKALQARAYLWFGDNSKAYDAAKTVIDAQNTSAGAKFKLGTAADFAAKDYVLTNEHIFALYDFALSTKYTRNFASGNIRKGTNATTINTQLYENTGTDIREANLWEAISQGSVNSYILKKYQSPDIVTSLLEDYKQIPLLRISEMYFIAIETAPDAEAQTLWNTFRASRNLVAASLSTDPVQKKLEIIKEYRKEFYGEGQGFYAYKRINAPKASIVFVPATATVDYTPPIPKTETTNN